MFQTLYSHYKKIFLTLTLLIMTGIVSLAQLKNNSDTPKKDSIPALVKKPTLNKYDSATKAHPPRAAAIRSAIIPGWGQIYNKKYWKVPIVYGALGTCAGIFFYNIKYYKDTKFAYKVKYNMRVHGTDSSLYSSINPLMKPLSEESLRNYRNQYRKDIDYSVLFFILFWGLNVVDATVDAHLKSFDVSPDLSLQIKPGHSEMAGTNGISFVLHIR